MNDIQPEGDQTPQQARNFAVAAFRYACRLEGLRVPAESAVFAAIRRMN